MPDRRTEQVQYKSKPSLRGTKQAGLSRNVVDLDRKINGLTERLLGTDSPSLISAYESQIEKLERKKIGIIEKSTQGIEPIKPFEITFKTAMNFLANPCIVWEKGNLHQKRLLLRMVFPNLLIYDREKGYRTPEIALPFKALGDLGNGIVKMVGVRRIELRTSSMSRKRSTTELYAHQSLS